MKKAFLLLACVSIGLFSCNESTQKVIDKPGCTDPSSLNYDPDATIDNGTCAIPQQKQMGFIVEYTATWCGPCGDWGAPKMHDIYKMGDVVGIAAHADGDPMYNAALYSSFNTSRPDGGGIPSFWIGDENNYNASTMTALKGQTAVAGVTFSNEKVGDKMNVKTMVKFFSGVSGDYYLSVYLLESGIDGGASAGSYKQNGTTDPNYKHDFVLRTAATPSNAYGEKIATGTIAAGTEIKKDYTITIDPTWDKNLYVAAVLWRLNGTMYEYVNAWEWGSHQSH
jgi:hypothetical protein